MLVKKGRRSKTNREEIIVENNKKHAERNWNENNL
jgi:hypothetical protein